MAAKDPSKDVYLPEVLFELRQVGKSVRVVAIDPITRTEVVMVVPSKTTREEIKRVAAQKLAYVLGKKKAEGDEVIDIIDVGDGEEEGNGKE